MSRKEPAPARSAEPTAAVESPAAAEPDDFSDHFRREIQACTLIASRICGSLSTGDEIAVQALGRTWASWWRIRHRSRPAAWTLRLAADLAMDHVRASHPVVLHDDDRDGLEIVIDQRALVDALCSLSRRERQSVSLRHLAGLSEQQAADRLGLSVETVEALARRGLTNLRAKLSDEELRTIRV